MGRHRNIRQHERGVAEDLLELPNGIPSHDTFGRVFARIDPKQFEECFLNWVRGVTEKITGVIAIDGKTLRRSHDAANGKKALHLVSAWAAENWMVLAQLAVDEKSNEITAIPELLKLLELEGCLVTIDAMGTQRAIAAQIIDQHADYALALKEKIKAICMKTSRIPLCSHRKMIFAVLSTNSLKRLKKLMGGSKSVNTGSLTILSN